MAESSVFQVLEKLLSLPRTRIQPGGYTEELFVSLPDNWKEKYQCSICFLVLKDGRQCKNGHKYCWCCIHVWSVTGVGENHALCPVCRVEGFYTNCKKINDAINSFNVNCLTKPCKWTGFLKDYCTHRHTFERSNKGNTESATESGLPAVGGSHTSNQSPRTATGLTMPRRRYPDITHTSSRISTPGSSVSLPGINIPPGVRPNPTYSTRRAAERTRERPRESVNGVPIRQLAERNSRRDIFRHAPDVRDIRRRLDSSRDRLQALLSVFGERLSQNERELATFQDDRERRRQEQLAEVIEIGERLGEVATQLRTWFNDQTSPGRDNPEQ